MTNKPHASRITHHVSRLTFHVSRFTPYLLLLAPLLLALPVIHPLLSNQLTKGYDNVLHLWRVLEADQALSQGCLYTRWNPNMVFGLGYPMLLFNPPISPLLGALLHRLGLSLPAAVNGVFALGTVLSGWSVWLLTRDEEGDGPALVAAAAMLTMPFHAYVNFHRASMSEALAWAFPGLILWGLRRWLKTQSRVGLLAATGGLAAMLLTHDAFAYLFLPLPALVVLASALAQRSWRVLWRGALAVGLGIGLATFFWLPSVLERSYVQFNRVLEYNYAASFVPLDYLLEPPRTADPTLINPWPPKGIGLLPALLALLSLGALWKTRDRERRAWIGTLWLFTIGYIWLASPYAAWFWKLLPPLAYLHFPWRFLSPAAVSVAVLAGIGINWLSYHVAALSIARSPTRHRVALSTAHSPARNVAAPSKTRVPIAHLTLITGTCFALILGALGWLYPHHITMKYPTTLSGMLIYEHETTWLGGTTFGELLPRWVKDLPDSTPLEEDIHNSQPPVRLRPESLPAGATILNPEDIRKGLNHAHIEIQTPVGFQALYWAFYYPGWRVWIDGDQVDIVPSDPAGLITFDVPPGRHTIVIRFGETPLHLAADALSILSLIGLVILFTYTRQRPSQHLDFQIVHNLDTGSLQKSPHYSLILLIAILALLLLKFIAIDHINTPLRRENLTPNGLRQVDVRTNLTFDEQFHMLGYDTLPDRRPADQIIPVTLYWQDTVPGGPHYEVGLALKDAQGLRWSDPAQYPLRWTREPPDASTWPPNQYAQTAYALRALPGTPPGIYTVTVSVFDDATAVTYPARGETGQTWGTDIVLGHVHLAPPKQSPPSIDARYHNNLAWDSLRLVGYNLDREIAAPGSPLLVTFFWKATAKPTLAYKAQLYLLTPEGHEAAVFNLPLVREDFPPEQWEDGDLWRGQHLLHLPASLESGEHTWSLHLCTTLEESSAPSGHTLGTLKINAPERHWDSPPLDLTANTQLIDVDNASPIATLLGATLEPGTRVHPGGTLEVVLVWRAEMETATSYRVFLHVLADNGKLITQSDGLPVDWTRPTTGWRPGEIVLDRRILFLPPDLAPGTYRLQAGMYTLEEGRLRTPEGIDTIVLGDIRIAGQ